MEPPTETNGGPFVRVGGSTRDKKPLSPTLARLAVGPGTKATFYPEPKGNRDKWPGTKAYSVVVPANNPGKRIWPPARVRLFCECCVELIDKNEIRRRDTLNDGALKSLREVFRAKKSDDELTNIKDHQL